ncbi:MAG: mechanosensitive ion channel family protein [Oscillospiraceae bacterium]|nr:mechanosensitive ion channel family protein [Oscillospiraceae bacterium]
MGSITAMLASLSLTALIKPLLVLVICLIAVKILLKVADKILLKSKLDKSLHAIIRSVAKILLLFVAVMIVASSLGINVSSLLAVLSIAGVAVSLAIQDILSNFFSGVVLLGAKPFKVGDFVTVGGQTGTIVETGITHTKLHTLDNQVILVPNSAVTSNVITNVTAEDIRRVDFVFSASYDSDPDTVKKALREAASIDLVLQDQPVFAELSKYGESAIEYTVRVWVKTGDYWDAYFRIMDRVRTAYAENGVQVTYPHINVHNV